MSKAIHELYSSPLVQLHDQEEIIHKLEEDKAELTYIKAELEDKVGTQTRAVRWQGSCPAFQPVLRDRCV